MLKEQPNLISAFMQVVSKAYEYTRRDNNVQEAVKDMIAQRPEAALDFQTAINMFNSHIAFSDSRATEGKPIGFIAKEDVEGTIKTLKQTGIIKNDVNPDTVFDPRFMPK